MLEAKIPRKVAINVYDIKPAVDRLNIKPQEGSNCATSSRDALGSFNDIGSCVCVLSFHVTKKSENEQHENTFPNKKGTACDQLF